MIAHIKYNDKTYQINFNHPKDISIPLGDVKCYHAPDVKMTPYTDKDFIGSVKSGAPVNYFNVALNPHGNGTHTECFGHITKEQETINHTLKKFHFIALLISVQTTKIENNDQIITLEEIRKQCPDNLPESLIIRTLPNHKTKLKTDYSDQNPPYLSGKAMAYLVEKNVKHLLIDLPSVDREKDDGVLEAHHIFWNLKENNIKNETRKESTITELIYIDNSIKDGLYLLNLQVVPLELDASPSRPVLYKLKETVEKQP